MLTIKQVRCPDKYDYTSTDLFIHSDEQEFPQVDLIGLGLTGFDLEFDTDDHHLGLATVDVAKHSRTDPNKVPITCTIGLRDNSWGNLFRTNISYALLGYTADILSTPMLISPADQQKFSNHPRITTLTWQPVQNATGYLVEVEFGDTAGTTWSLPSHWVVSGTSWTFEFVGDQPGRWRVTAQDSTGNYKSSAPSAWRYFSYVYIPLQKLATPALVSPAEGQVFSIFPRKTTLTWQPVQHANKYQVEVEYQSGTIWAKAIPDAQVQGTSYIFNFVGAQPGRWRVTALDSTGAYKPSDPSAWRTFKYTA